MMMIAASIALVGLLYGIFTGKNKKQGVQGPPVAEAPAPAPDRAPVRPAPRLQPGAQLPVPPAVEQPPAFGQAPRRPGGGIGRPNFPDSDREWNPDDPPLADPNAAAGPDAAKRRADENAPLVPSIPPSVPPALVPGVAGGKPAPVPPVPPQDAGKGPAATAEKDPPLKSYPIRIAIPNYAVRVDAATPLKEGTMLGACWGKRWYNVTALKIHDDDTVTIRWSDFGPGFDNRMRRDELVIAKPVLQELQRKEAAAAKKAQPADKATNAPAESSSKSSSKETGDK